MQLKPLIYNRETKLIEAPLTLFITATIKGEVDMAIGNIIGSQIFNILLIIAITSLLHPIVYSIYYNLDFLVLIAGTILFVVFPYIGKKKK